MALDKGHTAGPLNRRGLVTAALEEEEAEVAVAGSPSTSSLSVPSDASLAGEAAAATTPVPF